MSNESWRSGGLNTTGHLFEKRYYPVLVDADEYLLELLRYIHLNPVRARMVASPDDYQWSSHHDYVGQRNEAWVTTDLALCYFMPSVKGRLQRIGTSCRRRWD